MSPGTELGAKDGAAGSRRQLSGGRTHVIILSGDGGRGDGEPRPPQHQRAAPGGGPHGRSCVPTASPSKKTRGEEGRCMGASSK